MEDCFEIYSVLIARCADEELGRHGYGIRQDGKWEFGGPKFCQRAQIEISAQHREMCVRVVST